MTFKTAKIFQRLILALLCIIGIWIYGLTSFVGTIPTKVEDPDSITDGIVILTGGSKRLEAGIDLLNKNKAKKLFVSGVGKETNLASLLILSGKLPDNISILIDRIELGYNAENTEGNAEETLKWINENNYKSIRLVTANYHINRSMAEFKKHADDIKIVPHPVFPEHIVLNKWWRSGGTKKLLVLEYNKYLISKLRSFV